MCTTVLCLDVSSYEVHTVCVPLCCVRIFEPAFSLGLLSCAWNCRERIVNVRFVPVSPIVVGRALNSRKQPIEIVMQEKKKREKYYVH